MIRLIFLGLFPLLMILTGVPEKGSWQVGSCRLPTLWTGSVPVEHRWLEYPRPQMVRGKRHYLNGLWDYAIVPLHDGWLHELPQKGR